MRILLVDDDARLLDVLEEDLRGRNATVLRATNGADAIAMIRSEQLDLVVCDLRIPRTSTDPPEDGVGREVLAEIAAHCPGTPTILLSAYANFDNVRNFNTVEPGRALAGAHEPFRLSATYTKSDLAPVLRAIGQYCEESDLLDRIEVATGIYELPLTHHHRRVLQIFAEATSGALVVVSPVVEGLSSVSKFKATVMDSQGGRRAVTFARIGHITHIEDEERRYATFVSVLPPGSFAQAQRIVRGGAGSFGGAFYFLAEGFTRSLYSLLAESPARAARAVATLRARMEPWRAARTFAPTTVGGVRRTIVPDDQFATLVSGIGVSGLDDFEAKDLVAPRLPQHRDLHGFNILLNAHDEPLLIDFADVEMASGPIDPVSLELGVAFHPATDAALRDLVHALDPSKWPRLHEYANGSPLQAFIEACRDWSHYIAESDRVVLATAYAYAARQFKYDGTDKVFARSLIEATVRSSAEW